MEVNFMQRQITLSFGSEEISVCHVCELFALVDSQGERNTPVGYNAVSKIIQALGAAVETLVFDAEATDENDSVTMTIKLTPLRRSSSV